MGVTERFVPYDEEENDGVNVLVFVFADNDIQWGDGRTEFLQFHDKGLEPVEGEIGIISFRDPEREIVAETNGIELKEELRYGPEIISEIHGSDK